MLWFLLQFVEEVFSFGQTCFFFQTTTHLKHPTFPPSLTTYLFFLPSHHHHYHNCPPTALTNSCSLCIRNDRRVRCRSFMPFCCVTSFLVDFLVILDIFLFLLHSISFVAPVSSTLWHLYVVFFCYSLHLYILHVSFCSCFTYVCYHVSHLTAIEKGVVFNFISNTFLGSRGVCV